MNSRLPFLCVLLCLESSSQTGNLRLNASTRNDDGTNETIPTEANNNMLFSPNIINKERQADEGMCNISNNLSSNDLHFNRSYLNCNKQEDLKENAESGPNALAEIDKAMKEILFYADPVIFSAGLILNVMGLIVLIDENKLNKSLTFLVCFFTCSTFLLVINIARFFTYRVKYTSLSDHAVLVLSWVILIFTCFLEFALRSITYAMYAVMSVISFVAVAFPFHMKRFLFSQHPIRTTCGLIFFYMIIFSFNLFRFKFESSTNPLTGERTFFPTYTELAVHNMDISDAYGFVGILITYLIPIPVTLTFFGLTLLTMRRSVNSNLVSCNAALRQTKLNQVRRLAHVFLSLSCLQVVVTLPTMICITIAKFDDEFKLGGRNVYIGNILQNVFGTLDNLKHGAVTILFFVMSSSFRAAFRKMYFRKKNDQPENTNVACTKSSK